MADYKHTYLTAEEDAEFILENIMHRQNYGYAVRDELAKKLERIVTREVKAVYVPKPPAKKAGK